MSHTVIVQTKATTNRPKITNERNQQMQNSNHVLGVNALHRPFGLFVMEAECLDTTPKIS